MYKARLFFDTAEDDYKDGENPNGTGTSWTGQLEAKTADELKTKITELVGEDWANFEQEDINEYPTATEYWTDYLANVDNYRASEVEVAAWKKGKQKLWNVSVHVLVSKYAETKATI